MATTERAEIVGEAIDAILTHLAAENIPHALDDTGGGCPCVRVPLDGGAWIWVSDDEGTLVIYRYTDEDDEIGKSLGAGDSLADMTTVIRAHLPTCPEHEEDRDV